MRLDAFIEGLQLLNKYTDEEYPLGAEHDIIYFYTTTRPVSEEDLKRLRELGWYQPEVPDNDDETPRGYDPEEHWAAWA